METSFEPLDDPELGNVILACHPKPMAEYHGSLLFMYILGAVLAAGFVFLLPWRVSEVLGEPNPLETGWGLLNACASLAVLGGTLWMAFVLPRKDRLVLYDHGFRYRIHFGGGVVRFEELSSLCVGRDVGSLERAVNEYHSQTNHPMYSHAQEMKGKSPTLRFRNGGTRELMGILHRFADDDVVAFLAHIQEHFPGLWEVAEPV